MQRKLTSSEEKAYKQAALEIYQREGHPTHLHEQCIKMDIHDMNLMLEWTVKMKKNPSPGLAMEALTFFVDENRREKQELKSLGCSDQEVEKLTLSTALKILEEVDILKKVTLKYQQAYQACFNKLSASKLFTPKKGRDETDTDKNQPRSYGYKK